MAGLGRLSLLGGWVGRRDVFLNIICINIILRGDINFPCKNIYFMGTIFFLPVVVDLKIGG